MSAMLMPIDWPPLPRSLADVADILALAFLLQRAWLMLRGTAALRYLLLLAAGWGGARLIGMPLTSWALLWIGPIALFTLIVAFRGEIREALLRTDPLHLLLGRQTAASTDLRALAEALCRMADDRIGALIVFRNRDPLDSHVLDGVTLDAKVGPELIACIFDKSCTMHDGAVIIRGRRIERAGAFLPLSKRPNLPAKYGTRHRAAIGLSERTDAVVIAVSEERGEVSIAHEGEIRQVTGADAIAAAIRHALPHDAGRSGRSPRVIARRIGRRAFGYAAAVAVVGVAWSVHMASNRGHSSLATFTVPLDYRNVPDGLSLRGDGPNGRPPESVEVQVIGVDLPVRTLHREAVVAFVDVAALPIDPKQGGDAEVRLGARNVEMPPGYAVEALRPDAFVLTLEGPAIRPLAVRPILGDPPRGFAFDGEPEAKPVRVIGPRSVVASADELSTESVSLRDVTPAADAKTVTFDAPLIVSPPALRLVNPADATIRVVVPIRKAAKE